ncbi:helix-turn-helix domain-containing protein [Ligilactobacillus salivarius]|uniref:helix-turn-helix domain-containing protein n=1 Tax=Ligilactobacillus salivarius TaxID=1624 RepID=UPI00187A7AD1|nr:helix-turn-helix transcriptional regulator [Ligilactobacillus salivarius]MBE7388204.1 helix-turn-helix transcriptional regulator [Ligilactobacillus salivarius]MBE7392760.1 helix-turn-helix transcriptional regulator [Ligilactobacillus salivarius]
MIRYNLNKLLGERNLKISKVFVDTGISRSTLTKIVNNQSSMVQTETIDKLCQYLKVSPSEFFEYIPIEIDVNTFLNEFNGFAELGLDLIIKIKDTFHNIEKEFVYTINENKKGEDNIFVSNEWYSNNLNQSIKVLEINFPVDFKDFVTEITNNNYGFSNDVYEKIKDNIKETIKNETDVFSKVDEIKIK